ncbi:MAG: hypothetical protein JRJ86_16240 [Deltaproteobacteria bacterium]|nr:hypothetical protein [Deltaproteobacteria bacterium]MBW2118985.1 hypothetical protein [Deltaproteobacteria bacterium]MBW2345719.1 hypothetical protein [Deltaproteobacteria bacterium]
MERKKAFEPGEMVVTFTGQAGLVISEELYPKVRGSLKEKRRPGYYFAPGCCQHPDYVIQVPILFEDGTYDVMRAMNIKKAPNLAEDKIAQIRNLLDRITH